MTGFGSIVAAGIRRRIASGELRSISELDTANPNCKRCEGIGWVCENHPDVPWAGLTGEPFCRSNVEGCGGAGMPCPDCNELSSHGQVKTKEPTKE